jgi:CheY-like chemotaxis protein
MPVLKILVVDDDPDVRELAVEHFREMGHQVLEASTGQEALELFEADPKIDIIFTDIMMPGISGFHVADLAKTWQPQVKIIYATGYADLAGEHSGPRHGQILLKPYRRHQLATAVARALA